MQFVTYCNIWLKCYLKLFNYFMIVLGERGSFNVLAKAIDIFNLFFNLLKKFKGYLFSSIYSLINSVTISLIVLCCLAAMIFNSVFSSESMFAINLVSLIFITPYVELVVNV